MLMWAFLIYGALSSDVSSTCGPAVADDPQSTCLLQLKETQPESDSESATNPALQVKETPPESDSESATNPALLSEETRGKGGSRKTKEAAKKKGKKGKRGKKGKVDKKCMKMEKKKCKQSTKFKTGPMKQSKLAEAKCMRDAKSKCAQKTPAVSSNAKSGPAPDSYSQQLPEGPAPEFAELEAAVGGCLSCPDDKARDDGCKDDDRQSPWLPGTHSPKDCAKMCSSMTPPAYDGPYEYRSDKDFGEYIFFEVSSQNKCKCLEVCQAASHAGNTAYVMNGKNGEDRVTLAPKFYDMCKGECSGDCAIECTLSGGGHHDMLKSGEDIFR